MTGGGGDGETEREMGKYRKRVWEKESERETGEKR